MKYINALNDLYETLESFLNIYEVVQNREKIMLKLKDSIDIRKLVDLFNKDLPIKMLNKNDLYYLVKGFKEFYLNNKDIIDFNDNLLEPKKYFTDLEIDEIKNTLILYDNENNETFKFENVIKLDDKQYIVGKIRSKELLNLIYNNFVKYDFKMQRESEKVTRNGITYERVKTYSNSINEIKESMKSNRYRPTPLSINILDRSDDEDIYDDELLETHFFYDEKNKTFTLSSKDRVSLIDGMHRLYAIMECYNEDPNFEQLMQLNIFFMTQKEARDYIYQEGQKNPINKGQLNRLNSADIYGNIITEIEKYGNKNNNFIQGLIGTDRKDISVLNKFTTFTKFMEALKDNVEIKSNDIRKQRELRRYFVLFFNELISLLQDEFNKISDLQNRFYSNPNMIYVYIKIATILKEERYNKEWEDNLFEIIYSEEFDIELKLILKKINNNFDISKKMRNEIYQIVEELVKKILK